MLIGLISGVRFLHILGRGLVAGVGAGSFVLCARILLERFIPDLFTPPASSNTAETVDNSSGANINITLDDELGVTADGNVQATGTPNSAGMQTDTQNTEAALVASTPDASDNGSAHEGAEISDSSPFSFSDGPQDHDGLSDLPSMGSFIDDDGFDENIDDSVQTDNSGFSMAGIQTGGSDSKVMAQAIRTVLATED